MSLWNSEQIAAAQRASADASLGFVTKAFESFEKVVDLNLKTVRSGIVETEEVVLNALSGKGTQEWGALQSGVMERVASRVQSCYSQLFAIASNAQLEFANVFNEHLAHQQRKLHSLIDDVARHAPSAAETAITALKSTITATGTWYETMGKATQQAIHVAESNVEAVSATVSKTAKRAVERATYAPSK